MNMCPHPRTITFTLTLTLINTQTHWHVDSYVAQYVVYNTSISISEQNTDLSYIVNSKYLLTTDLNMISLISKYHTRRKDSNKFKPINITKIQ